MHFLQSAVCFVLACGLCQAWYNRYSDNAVFGGGWTPDRRSLKSGRYAQRHTTCVGKNKQCMNSYQCCPDDDSTPLICMKENSFGFGECKSSKLLSNYPAAKFGYKKAGRECTDSSECADQCCRVIRMGRMGSKTKCGKPFGDACVGKLFSRNDVMFYDQL